MLVSRTLGSTWAQVALWGVAIICFLAASVVYIGGEEVKESGGDLTRAGVTRYLIFLTASVILAAIAVVGLVLRRKASRDS